MRFNFDLIRNIKDRKLVSARILEYIKECTKQNDPPVLTDFLADKGGLGGSVLRILGGVDHENMMSSPEECFSYKLKVLRDEWGKKLLPGEFVLLKKAKRSAKDADERDIANAKRMGTYEDDYLDIRKFKIDKKGCITCRFQDAVSFLNNYGLHAITGLPVTNKEEITRDVVKHKDDDGKKIVKHLWYWRFQEVTKEQYKDLPEIKKQKLDNLQGSPQGNTAQQ